MPAVRLLFAGAVALVAVVLYAAWAVSPEGLGRWPAHAVAPAAEAERAQRLAAQGEALLRHVAVSNEIRQELIAGRLTLREAAAALAEENAGRPASARLRVDLLPGRDDEERWCRSTVTWVGNMMGEGPRRDAALARLRAELDDLLAARED